MPVSGCSASPPRRDFGKADDSNRSKARCSKPFDVHI